jgi:glutamate formiminotransferase
MKTQLGEQEVEALQEKIVREHWMPDTEQFGHLEYMASYTVEGVRYIFHKKSLMGLTVYRLEDK